MPKQRQAKEHCKPPRLLIVGGGAITAECYIPALSRLGWNEHAMVIDTSEAGISKIKTLRHSTRARVGDYRTIFNDRSLVSEFNGAVVALPNSLHEDAVVRAMDCGLDVLCEKPLAMDLATCQRLAAAAEERKRKLSVAMVRRFIPSIVAIGNAIRDGLIGEVLKIDIGHGGAFHWPAQSISYFQKENGGIFLNMGIHYLDILQSWVGKLDPKEYVDDAAGGVEANCRILLQSQAGAQVSLRLSYTNELDNRILVKGTKGEIKASLGNFASAGWSLPAAGLVGELRPANPFSEIGLRPDFVSSFAEQFISFGKVIARQIEPLVSAREAISTQEIIEWGYSHRLPMFVSTEKRFGRRPQLEPARVVVTGGSGFLGVNLVQRLCEMGFTDIVVPVRSFQSGANVSRFPVTRIVTDLLDLGDVRAAVSGAKYVFHLAYGGARGDPTRVTTEGTKNVVDAAVDAGVESLVVVSTASVFGHPPTGRPIDETFPYRPALGEYGASKAAAEQYALRKAKSSTQTRISVINPSAIYGPNGALFTQFPIQAAKAGQFAWIDDGKGKFNYTFVQNVVDALILAASCEGARGENFIISDGVCTFRQFFTPLLGGLADSVSSYSKAELVSLERKGRPTWKDLVAALLNDEVMEAINGIPALKRPKKVIERYSGVYAWMQGRRKQIMHESSAKVESEAASGSPPSWLADIFGPIQIEYNSEKAGRILGWRPLVSFETGIDETLSWLKSMNLA